jgi:hypothetical protein
LIGRESIFSGRLVAGQLVPGDEFGAHLDRLDRAGGARLQRQPDREDDDARDEERGRPEHEQPEAAQAVRRSADQRSDSPAYRAGGQLVTL